MLKTFPKNPWVSFPRPNSAAGMRLFCFPYAGGGAMLYRRWPDALPPGVEVCPVQLPGRGSRLHEAGIRQMPQLVSAVAEAIDPFLGKPFAFFGHSMGAVVAFELSRLLRRLHGLRPTHLFVSGHSAPQVPNRHERTYDLPESEFIEELRRLNGTPREVLEHPELMELMIPTLRTDFEVCQTYSYAPGPPLDCPITAFVGSDDEVGYEDQEAWREQTVSHFSLHTLPGDHFFIHASEAHLLRMLSQELRQLVRSAA